MGLLDRVRDRQNPTNGEATTAAPKAPNGAPAAAEKTASSAPSGHGHASRPTPHGGHGPGATPNGGPPKPTFQRRSTADPSAAKVAAPDSAAARADAKRASLGSKAAERKQVNPQREQLGNLKIRIHSELIDRLDLAALGKLGPEQASEQIQAAISQLLDAEGAPLSREDRKRLEAEITSEVLGYGPLDVLLKDDTIADILVNSASQTYVERRGKLELTNVTFRDDDHLIQIIDRIVSKIGRRIDTASPLCDARLPDGSRVNAVIPPIALDGPS
ncbi:MAG TPA: ATPase, T2SS/T4P/T4SS family, partial [Candidatus Binatia bacterium]|nr:ATPase, T2SS/T4P/T4SS family [Candidatus Binatia bacterium]